MTTENVKVSPTVVRFGSSPIPPGGFPALYVDEAGGGFVITWRWREMNSVPEYTRVLMRGHSTTDALYMAKEVAENTFNLSSMWPEVSLDDAHWMVEKSYYLTGASMALAALMGLITFHKGVSWPERLLVWGGLLPSRNGILIQPTNQGSAKMQCAAALGATRVICPDADVSESMEFGINVKRLASRSWSYEMVVKQLVEILENKNVR